MKIVIDLQACQSGSRLGGIGRYSMNLAEGLMRQAGEHELVFILNNLFPETIESIYTTLGKSIPKSQIRVFNVPGPVNESNPDNFSRMHIAEILREKFIYNLQPDIVFVSSLIEGLGDDVVTSVGKVTNGEQTSVTLYDLIPLVEQEKYLQDPISKQHYLRKIEYLKNAGSLLAISEFSRQEAIDVLKLNPSVITTISSAIDNKFQPIEFVSELVLKVHQTYGIVKNFLLYTGSFDQRKNHERLIKAFTRLPLDIRSQYQLVIIGNGWDGIYAHFRNIAVKEGLTPQDIIFAGHVPDQDLLVIYNTASLFVFPSLSEGFGLPVLEAMSCGIPTIGSNTTSIPEVIGFNDALFDPYDIDSMTSKIYEVLTNASFQNILKHHGLQYSKNFSWDNSAQKAISAFEEQYERLRKPLVYDMPTLNASTMEQLATLIEKEKLIEADVVKIASAVDMNDMASRDMKKEQKIGLISTWNSRCGIAMYSKHLCAKYQDKLTIFAPYDNDLVEVDTKNVIRSWTASEDNLEKLMKAIDSQKITTVVIQFNYGLFSFSALKLFIQEMVAQGRFVYITLHSTTDTPEKKLEELASALSLCQKVIVHSENDFKNLENINICDNVILFPQGVIDTVPNDIVLNVDNEKFIIGTYGFFLPHKGFLDMIDIINELIQEGVNAHLLMINAEYPANISKFLINEVKEKARRYGIEEHITLVTSFLSNEDSLGYLKNADVIVYPYQETGESSSAAVRMGIASGKIVAVTPLNIFDDVQETVLKLSSTSSKDIAKDIKALREKLLLQDESINAIISKAHQWYEEHSYSKLGEKFWNVITTIK